MNSTGIKSSIVHDDIAGREGLLAPDKGKQQLVGRVGNSDQGASSRAGMVWSQNHSSGGVGAPPPPFVGSRNNRIEYEGRNGGNQDWDKRDGYDQAKNSSDSTRTQVGYDQTKDSSRTLRMDKPPTDSPRMIVSPKNQRDIDGVISRSGSDSHLSRTSSPTKPPSVSNSNQSSNNSPQHRTSPLYEAPMKPKSRFIQNVEGAPGSARDSPAGTPRTPRTPTPSGSHSSRASSPNKCAPRPQNNSPTGSNSTICGSPTRFESSISRSGSPRRSTIEVQRCDSPTRLRASSSRPVSPTKLGPSVARRESPSRPGRVESPRLGSTRVGDPGRFGVASLVDQSQYRTSPTRQNSRRRSPIRQIPRQTASPIRQNYPRVGSPFRPSRNGSPDRSRQSPVVPQRVPESQIPGSRPGSEQSRNPMKSGTNGGRAVYRDSPKSQNSPSPHQRRSSKNKDMDYREVLMAQNLDYGKNFAAAAAGQLIRPEYHPAMLLAAGYPPELLVSGASRTQSLHGGPFLPHVVLQHQQLQQEQMRLYPQLLMREQQAVMEVTRALTEGRRPGDGRGLPAPEGHAAAALTQLEQLWQRKYPTHSIPPAWMLYQYQDELLREIPLHPSINPSNQHSAGSGADPRTSPGSRARDPRREEGREHGGGRDMERVEWERRARDEQSEREKQEREKQIERERMREKLTNTDKEHLRVATMAAMDRRGAPWDTSRDVVRRQAPPNNLGHVSTRPHSQSGSAQGESQIRGEALSGEKAHDAVNQHFEVSLMRIGLAQKVEAAGPLEVQMPAYPSNYPLGVHTRGPETPLVSPNPYASDRVTIERLHNPALMSERSRRPEHLGQESRPRSPSAGQGNSSGNTSAGNSNSSRNTRQEIPTFSLYGYRPDVKYQQQPGMERRERISPVDNRGKNSASQEIPSRGDTELGHGDQKSVIVERRGPNSSGVAPAAYRGGGSITLGTAAHHYRPEGGPEWRGGEEAMRGLHPQGQQKEIRNPNSGSRPASRHSTVSRHADQPRFSPSMGEQQQQQRHRWPGVTDPQRFASPTNFSAEHLIERRDAIGQHRGAWEHSAATQVGPYNSQAPRDQGLGSYTTQPASRDIRDPVSYGAQAARDPGLGQYPTQPSRDVVLGQYNTHPTHGNPRDTGPYPIQGTRDPGYNPQSRDSGMGSYAHQIPRDQALGSSRDTGLGPYNPQAPREPGFNPQAPRDASLGLRERPLVGTPTNRSAMDPSQVIAPQTSSINLIQQGLVPNPLYTPPTGGTVSSHMMLAHPGLHQVQRTGMPDESGARFVHGGRISPGCDETGSKRRNTGRKEATNSGDVPDKKRLRYTEAGGERYPDESGSYRYGTGLPPDGEQGDERSNAAYIDSFKTFVDRTVQDAFYCPDLSIESRLVRAGASEIGGGRAAMLAEPQGGPTSEEERRKFEHHMRQVAGSEKNRSSPMVAGCHTSNSAVLTTGMVYHRDGMVDGRESSRKVVTEQQRNGAMESKDDRDMKRALNDLKKENSNSWHYSKNDARDPGLSSSDALFSKSQDNLMTSIKISTSPKVQSNLDDCSQSSLSSHIIGQPPPDHLKSSNATGQDSTLPLSQSPPLSSATPPPGSAGGQSSASHSYTKKAWLQRYDQDKKVDPPTSLTSSEPTQNIKCTESVVASASSSTVDLKKEEVCVKKEEVCVKKEELDVKKEIKEEEKPNKETAENSLGFPRFRDSVQGVATVIKSEPTSTSSDLEDAKSADSTGSAVQRKTRARRNKEKAAATTLASSSSPASSSRRGKEPSSCGGRGRGAAADSPPMPKLVQEENNSLHLADSSDNVDSPCRSSSSSGRVTSSPERPHLGSSGRGRGARSHRDIPSGIEQDEEEDDEQDEEQDTEEGEEREEGEDLEEPSRRVDRRNKHTSDCEAKLALKDSISGGKTRGSPSSHAENKLGGGGRITDKKRRRCSKEPFLQDGSCSELTPKLIKCRECKMSRTQRNKTTPNIFCRFYAFRKLRYSAKGLLTVAGFLRPLDSEREDIALWLPMKTDGDVQTDQAKYILSHIVSAYSKLVELEKQSLDCLKQTCVAQAAIGKVAWKRALQGVREMCDACNASLFNIHWACNKCGFAVCAQCFAERATGCGEDSSPAQRKDATRDWLTCSANRQVHDLDSLMITQIIPSDVQTVIGRMLTEVLDKHNISINQSESSIQEPTGRDLYEFTNGDSDSPASDESRPSRCSGSSSYATQNGGGEGEKKRKRRAGELKNGDTHDYSEDDDEDETCPPPLKRLGADSSSSRRVIEGKRCSVRMDRILPNRILANAAVESPHRYLQDRRLLYLTDPLADNVELFQKHWLRALPVLVADCTGTTAIPDLWTPDSFRREFAGLRADLVDCSTGAILRGQSTEKFWSGFEAACNVVGNSVVSGNSSTGNTGTGKQKPTGNSGTISQPVLRLKEWPAVDDVIGARWHRDLARTLPIREYTLPTGVFNLVSHLPEFFGRPELAVKIHAGYGSAAQGASVSFSRLHSLHADCVNVLMYVEAPANETDAQKAALTKSLKEAGCCNVIKYLSGLSGKKVGAVWHIFRPQDGGKIKDFLAKQQQSGRGTTNNNSGWSSQKPDKCHSNPLGNGFGAEGGGASGFDGQSWYLDRSLRARLLTECDVQCTTVVQCLGDAVFIPALSPFQVKNLYSCISASKEFLSPESIDLCYQATQQLRQSSMASQQPRQSGVTSQQSRQSSVTTQKPRQSGLTTAAGPSSNLPLIDLLDTNQEEMLQVENVIFHAVKSSIAVLRESEET